MKKKVLIVGTSSKEYALAKKLSETCEVYAAPGNDNMRDFAVLADIRENSSKELIEYALENGIDMIVPVSTNAVNTDIYELCRNNNIHIFGPDKISSKYLFDKFSAKKIMYKLGIPTPKFGIFEKQNAAADYIKNQRFPLIFKNNNPVSAVIITSMQTAKTIYDSYFSEKDSKLLVEDYMYGTAFAFYAVTDGYNAMPIGSSILYKYSLEGNGGQLTSGMGACSPNYKLSFENEEFLMNSVIYPTLDYLSKNGANYTGIMGIEGILTDSGEIKILGYCPFMQDADGAGILGLIDTDLYSLFEACSIGSFSDEYNYIKQKDISTVSLVLACKNTDKQENVVENLDNIDENILISYTQNAHKNKYLETEAAFGSVMVLTAFAGTISSATDKVYDEVKNINFRGLRYRKDIAAKALATANV